MEKTLKETNNFALAYHKAITSEAREYLHNRGINDESIEAYKLGFGNVRGTTWITIPVYDKDGKIAYIKLRHFPEDTPCIYDRPVGKYMNYPTGCETILFDEAKLQDAREVMIVEGEFDAIIANQHDLPPTVSIPSATVFKPEWTELMQQAEAIYVWLDNDETGKNAQEELIKKLTKLCPNSTIYKAPMFENIKDATDYFLSGRTEAELMDSMEYAAGPPVISDSDLDEMSLDQLADILDETIKCDRYNKCILFAGMLTTYTEQDQLNICLLGQSSSGKTYLAQEVAKYFPEEDIKEYAEVSPTAFKHMSPIIDEETGKEYVDLERKVMLFTEMPHPALLANLRPLLSHDRKEIEFLTTDKGKTGGNTAKSSVIRGFPSVIFCSAYTKLDEQEATRCLLLSPEISNEKVSAGVELTSQRLANLEAYQAKLALSPTRQSLMRRVRYIKSLNINSVIIRDSDEVLERFKKQLPNKIMQPRCQRDIAHIYSLIKASAMLNAKNRIDENGNVIVKQQDIDAGFKLWEMIGKTQVLGVPPAVYDFYDKFILPVYKKIMSNGLRDINGVLTDGVTVQEILSYHYKQTGSTYNNETFRKQIIPPLQIANLIQIERRGVANYIRPTLSGGQTNAS